MATHLSFVSRAHKLETVVSGFALDIVQIPSDMHSSAVQSLIP